MSKKRTKCLDFILTFEHAKTNSDHIFFWCFQLGEHIKAATEGKSNHTLVSQVWLMATVLVAPSSGHMNDQHIQIVFHACRYCGSLLLQDAGWLIFVVEFALDKIFDVQLCHVVDNVSIKTLVKENKRYSTSVMHAKLSEKCLYSVTKRYRL